MQDNRKRTESCFSMNSNKQPNMLRLCILCAMAENKPPESVPRESSLSMCKNSTVLIYTERLGFLVLSASIITF